MAIRPPTGTPPTPLILLAADPTVDRRAVAAAFASYPGLNRTYWLDLDGRADAYGGADARYLIVDGADVATIDAVIDTVGELADLAGQINPRTQGPEVLIIDGADTIYRVGKDSTSLRARRSLTGRQRLAADPYAAVAGDTGHWNDVHSQQRTLVRALATYPGIVVALARLTTVPVVDDSGAVTGVDHRVDVHPDLADAATLTVYLTAAGTDVRTCVHPTAVTRADLTDLAGQGGVFDLGRLLLDVIGYRHRDAAPRRPAPLAATATAPVPDIERQLRRAIAATTLDTIPAVRDDIAVAVDRRELTDTEAGRLFDAFRNQFAGLLDGYVRDALDDDDPATGQSRRAAAWKAVVEAGRTKSILPDDAARLTQLMRDDAAARRVATDGSDPDGDPTPDGA